MYPNLNAEMSRYKLSQKDICSALSIGSATLSEKMNGKKDFKLKECKKIKELFFKNCTIDYLFSECAIESQKEE